jgi:uncharacterized protein (DUF2267 family)
MREAATAVDHTTFVTQVRRKARIGSDNDAERAIRAALETLAECIPLGDADDFAAQLPDELAGHVRRRASDDPVPAGQFDLDAYIDRLAGRERVDRTSALFHARVVYEVLDEATTGELMATLREVLPPGLHGLVTAGTSADLRP